MSTELFDDLITAAQEERDYESANNAFHKAIDTLEETASKLEKESTSPGQAAARLLWVAALELEQKRLRLIGAMDC